MNKNVSPRTADRIVTIAVDVQKDFCPGGSLAVAGGDKVTAPLNDMMAYTRERGGTVVATRDWHPDQTPHFDAWPVHCVAGTEGASFHPSLDVRTTDVIINKGTGQTDGYSGFDGEAIDHTTIEQIIQPRTLRERVAVLIGGLATDYCVRATALDAAKQADRVREARQGVIDVYVLEDAIRAVNVQPEDGARAIQEMKDAGIQFVTTAGILD